MNICRPLRHVQKFNWQEKAEKEIFSVINWWLFIKVSLLLCIIDTLCLDTYKLKLFRFPISFSAKMGWNDYWSGKMHVKGKFMFKSRTRLTKVKDNQFGIWIRSDKFFYDRVNDLGLDKFFFYDLSMMYVNFFSFIFSNLFWID